MLQKIVSVAHAHPGFALAFVARHSPQFHKSNACRYYGQKRVRFSGDTFAELSISSLSRDGARFLGRVRRRRELAEARGVHLAMRRFRASLGIIINIRLWTMTFLVIARTLPPIRIKHDPVSRKVSRFPASVGWDAPGLWCFFPRRINASGA